METVLPYTKCKIMLDYPNMPRASTQHKKEGSVTYDLKTGLPKLLVEYGKQLKQFDLDSKELTHFNINKSRISDGLVSISLMYSYGSICNIMISEPLTMDGLYTLVEALTIFIH